MDELEIINRAKMGDDKAFYELMKRYKSSMFFMIYQMVNNVTTAEDLTMESFEKAFKAIKRYSPDCKFSTWLHRICKNSAIDYQRVRSNRPYFDEIDGNIHQIYELSPEEELISSEKVTMIENAIKNIKGTCRKIIELRIEGNSYDEIATLLNIPIGTVKANIHRTRKKILKEIE